MLVFPSVESHMGQDNPIYFKVITFHHFIREGKINLKNYVFFKIIIITYNTLSLEVSY